MSAEYEAAATDVHFTGDGTGGCGGRVAGDNTASVALSMEGAKFGGTTKCNTSSLKREVLRQSSVDPTSWKKERKKEKTTHTPTAKNETSVLGHHSTEPTLPSNFHRLTSFPTMTSHMLTTPVSSPLTAQPPSGLMLNVRTRPFG